MFVSGSWFFSIHRKCRTLNLTRFNLTSVAIALYRQKPFNCRAYFVWDWYRFVVFFTVSVHGWNGESIENALFCNLTLRKDCCFTVLVDTGVHYEATEKKLHKLMASVSNLNSCTKRLSVIWFELTCAITLTKIGCLNVIELYNFALKLTYITSSRDSINRYLFCENIARNSFSLKKVFPILYI